MIRNLTETAIISLFILFLCAACKSEVKDQGQQLIFDDRPVSHQLDTAVGYCYQMANASVEERYEFSILGNRLEGKGTRIYTATQKVYQINVVGQIDGKEVKAEVTTADSRNLSNATTTFEYWMLDEQDLQIKQRMVDGSKKDIQFIRINCFNHQNKDSSKYETFNGFFEGYAVVSKKGKYGLMNENMELTIPYKYADLGVVNEGSIVFYDEQSGKKGLLDVRGNILVAADYAEIHCFNEGLAAFLNEDGLWGFMDKSMNVVIKPQFKGINFFLPDPSRHPFNEGLANVQMSNDKWNFIDTKGNIVIKGDYLFTEAFKDGKARVYKNNKWFYINKGGQCIEDCDE